MQQRQSFQANAPISDDITRLAHEQQLGTPQAGYLITQLRRGWRWFRFGLLAFLAITVLYILLALIGLNDPTEHITTLEVLLPLYLIALLLFSIYALLSVAIYRPHPLYVCEGGLVLKQSASRFKIIRWKEIETIYQTMTRTPTSSFFSGYICTIHCHDGNALIFTGVRKSLAGLRKTLEEQFTRLHLPFQLADYRAGHILRFGPLSLNREGVTAGDRMLFWEQVADIALVKERRVVIYRAGAQQETWLSLPAIKVPNLGLLLALYKRIRSGQTEQEVSAEALAAYGSVPTLVQSGRRVDALPAELAALAEEQRLGERRLDQHLGSSRLTSRADVIALTITSVILLAGGVACGMKSIPISANTLSSFLIEAAFFCLLFSISGIVSVIHQLQHIHNYTYTFERGMLLKRGQQAPVIFRWEEIETVWRVPAFWQSKNKQAVSSQRLYAHRLLLRNGASYVLTRLNIRQDVLGKIIKEQIVPAQLPVVVDAYQAGQTISFGEVQVSRQGIGADGRLLPWDQVKSVSLLGTRLVIYDITRRKPWHSLPEKKIPNLFLLFALADYARNLVAQP